MTKNFALLLLLLFLAIGCTETENPKQDLIPSDAVEIGDQVWMKRNLDVKIFKNGLCQFPQLLGLIQNKIYTKNIKVALNPLKYKKGNISVSLFEPPIGIEPMTY